MHYAYCLHSYIHLYLVVIINVTNSIIDHFLDLKECQVLILKKKEKKKKKECQVPISLND